MKNNAFYSSWDLNATPSVLLPGVLRAQHWGSGTLTECTPLTGSSRTSGSRRGTREFRTLGKDDSDSLRSSSSPILGSSRRGRDDRNLLPAPHTTGDSSTLTPGGRVGTFFDLRRSSGVLPPFLPRTGRSWNWRLEVLTFGLQNTSVVSFECVYS